MPQQNQEAARRRSARTRAAAALVARLALALAPGASPADAWPEAYGPCRKALKVDAPDGAAVTAATTVFLDSRFTGFALRDAQGAERPCGLLDAAGGLTAFYFAARGGETLYLYPAATAARPAPGLDHTSGLLHQARAYDGREVLSAAQFDELWRAAPHLGARFEEQVYSAFNPFGANSNTLHRYDGFLRVDQPGETAFCTASTDASFLLLNGREVASWPGRHPVKAGLDGSRRGRVSLQPGLYRFTYLHANGGAESYAIAAHVPPGETRHSVIPAAAFPPASYALVGPLEARDGAPQAEFLWEHRQMVNLRSHALYALAFEAALPKGSDAACAWDFGDGARGSGAKAEHLYFAAGPKTVTLNVTFADGRTAVSRQAVAVTPRHGQEESNEARTLALLDQAVRQERESAIEPAGYALISRGFFFYLKEERAAAFAERALAAADRLPPDDVAPLFNELALGVQPVNESYELAERCFRALLKHAPAPRARASAALHLAGLLNLCLNRPQEARDLLASLRREDLADWEPRLLDIYLADAALVLDDVATARRLYLAIPKPANVVDGSRLDRAALFDYNTRHFRLQNLLTQKLYREALEELDLLEWEIPEERAAPRTNLLKVRALAGNGQPRKAVVCLQRALLADVDETCRPALRLELARLYDELGQLAQAKHQAALIRKESPWTQEEIDARKLVEDIDRRLGEEPAAR